MLSSFSTLCPWHNTAEYASHRSLLFLISSTNILFWAFFIRINSLWNSNIIFPAGFKLETFFLLRSLNFFTKCSAIFSFYLDVTWVRFFSKDWFNVEILFSKSLIFFSALDFCSFGIFWNMEMQLIWHDGRKDFSFIVFFEEQYSGSVESL